MAFTRAKSRRRTLCTQLLPWSTLKLSQPTTLPGSINQN